MNGDVMEVVSILKGIRHWLLIKLNKSNISYGKKFSFGRGTVFYAPNEINIGSNVYIGKYCSIETDAVIGNNILIGNNVGLIGRYDHDYSKIGTSIKDSPWIGDPDYSFKGKGLKVEIQDDVWIGYGSIILSGVTVGKGSIIAAGSVVTKSMPPYSICAGNPCRVVKDRFSSQEIKEHEVIIG